jgi:hypothetical protein
METKLQDILSDYDISAPDRTVERVACEVINKQCNTDLETNEVRYNRGTLWVDTTPLVRSQIHMKKSDITKEISKKLDKRSISQIN